MGFVGYCFGSRYAAGSCNLGVPFYDTCNTQLHVGLSAFHLLVPFEGTLLGASLSGSFLHFLQCVHMFIQLMYPLHLGLKVALLGPILVVLQMYTPLCGLLGM